jgi:hypothetical protein
MSKKLAVNSSWNDVGPVWIMQFLQCLPVFENLAFENWVRSKQADICYQFMSDF